MYDWPEVHDAVDALWSAIADCLRAAGIDGIVDLRPVVHRQPGNRSGVHWPTHHDLTAVQVGWPSGTRP